MAKSLAVCCFLLVGVCQSACVAEQGTCSSDEAALLQKDVQVHESQEVREPTKVDLKETSTHVSEAISLAVFLDKAEARNKLAKELNAKVQPEMLKVMGFVDAYHKSKRTPKDVNEMATGVWETMTQLVEFLDEKVKAGRGREAESRQKLTATLDDMEHEGKFGTKLVTFATKWGENKLLHDLAAIVFAQHAKMYTALHEYQTLDNVKKGGFDDKSFGKFFGVMNGGTMEIRAMFDTWDKIGDVKLKEVKEAKAKYTDHSMASLNDAIWQQVALEKAEERAAMARRLNDKFKPLGNMMLAEAGTYQSSSHTTEDLEKLNKGVMKGLEDIELELLRGMRQDAVEKEEAMAGLNTALDKMENEGEFAAKLTRFTTAWGRSKLAEDLLAQVQGHRDRVAKDMEQYNKQTAGRTIMLTAKSDSGDDKLFGQLYGSINTAAVGLMSSFGQWTITGYTKIGEISEGNEVLKSYEKA